jgi:hypothetical protein
MLVDCQVKVPNQQMHGLPDETIMSYARVFQCDHRLSLQARAKCVPGSSSRTGDGDGPPVRENLVPEPYSMERCIMTGIQRKLEYTKLSVCGHEQQVLYRNKPLHRRGGREWGMFKCRAGTC